MADNKSLMRFDDDYEERPKPILPRGFITRKIEKARLKDQLEIATYMAEISDKLLTAATKKSEANVIASTHDDKIREAHELIEHRRKLREIEIRKGNNDVLSLIILNETNKQKQLQAEIETMNHQFEYEQKLKNVGVENVITVEQPKAGND